MCRPLGRRRAARLRQHHAGSPGADERQGAHLARDSLWLPETTDQRPVEESDERPVAELDDARRRYYRLTRLGWKVLKLERERLEGMVRMAQKRRKQEAY